MLKNLTFNATNPFQLNKTALLIGESKRKKKRRGSNVYYNIYYITMNEWIIKPIVSTILL